MAGVPGPVGESRLRHAERRIPQIARPGDDALISVATNGWEDSPRRRLATVAGRAKWRR